jgi:hypothetical protein
MFVGSSAATDNRGGRSVPGSHAEDIVVDYFEGEDWAALDDAAEAEPDLDLPPLPPPSSRPSAA